MSVASTVQSQNSNGIALQTRARNDIPNSQGHEFSAFEMNMFSVWQRDYQYATFRTLPNPIYNCHGFTFASRRTGIHDNEALKTILLDDGYTCVKKTEIHPGDIILYYAEDGDIEHSGIVVSKPGQLGVPLVVSKWGKHGEVVHQAHDCPYDFRDAQYYRVTRWD